MKKVIFYSCLLFLASVVSCKKEAPSAGNSEESYGLASGEKNQMSNVQNNDLIYFSISNGSKVSGFTPASGILKGGYFFEAKIRVNILGTGKKILKRGSGTATSNWATAGPVDFRIDLDFSGLPTGPGFIQIMNDNPSGDPINDKSIFIPIKIQ